MAVEGFCNKVGILSNSSTMINFGRFFTVFTIFSFFSFGSFLSFLVPPFIYFVFFDKILFDFIYIFYIIIFLTSKSIFGASRSRRRW